MTQPLRIITDGLAFPEGPLELPNGDILVTEIRAGRLTRIVSAGRKSVFAETGGGPNGAAIGPDGAIYVTQNGGMGREIRIPGQIQRVPPEGGAVATLYTECDGNPLIAPNDLVFDRHGNFYFTDLGRFHRRTRDLGGLYYAAADGSFIREVVYPMEAANGCALSPDESTVYVGETVTGRVWAFTLSAPGEVASRRVLGTVPGAPPAYLARCDSMCVDSAGNVLQATIDNGGITVFAPDGTVTHHPTGDPFTTNCCFGGPSLRTLYVTLSTAGQLAAFDDWPVPGLRLAFQR
jgi:gluconolactonase